MAVKTRSRKEIYGGVVMGKGKNQHVVKHPDGWAVKGEGNKKKSDQGYPHTGAGYRSSRENSQKPKLGYEDSWPGR